MITKSLIFALTITKKRFTTYDVFSRHFKLLLRFIHSCQTIGSHQNDLIPLGCFLLTVDVSMN